jgi:hypothetical protein
VKCRVDLGQNEIIYGVLLVILGIDPLEPFFNDEEHVLGGDIYFGC